MRSLIKNIILVLLACVLLAGIAWARNREDRVLCQRVDVEIVNRDSTQFVTERGVRLTLAEHGFNVVGRRMSDIDAAKIERLLKQSDFLENVECVKAKDGVLLIRVSQLVPVLRVFDGDHESYYVNAAGKRMAATATFSADVPVVQGHFTDAYPVTRLLPMVQYVERDTFLHSLVTMYTVRDSNNIFITPNLLGHVVNMGPVDGYAQKFEKLRLFYSQVMPAKGWDTYDTISVKWNHQVVATKRNKAVRQEWVYDPADDEAAPDMETMGVGDTIVRGKKDEVKSSQEKAKPEKAKPEQSKPEKAKPEKAKQDKAKPEKNKPEKKR